MTAGMPSTLKLGAGSDAGQKVVLDSALRTAVKKEKRGSEAGRKTTAVRGKLATGDAGGQPGGFLVSRQS